MWFCQKKLKKFFNCSVLFRQRIIYIAKVSAISEATTDLTNFKCAVWRMNQQISTEIWREETFHIHQANLSGPSFCFRKTAYMATCGNEQNFTKQNFEKIRQHHLTSLHLSLPCLSVMYVGGGVIRVCSKNTPCTDFKKFH